MTVSPRRPTAACSRSTSAGDLHHHLVLDQAGFGGRRNIHDPAVEARQDLPSAGSAGGGAGGGCGGSRMASWTLVTTGGVLSAASCVVAVRFWMTCVCCAASDCQKLGLIAERRGVSTAVSR